MVGVFTRYQPLSLINVGGNPMKAKELKAKWRKDIEKDFIRELNLDQIRLRDKEKK